MIFIWVMFVSQLLLFFILKPFLPDGSTVSIVFVNLHLLLVLAVLSRYERNVAILLVAALLTRVSAMLWDIYARGIYVLPHSGTDTEGYLESGLAIAHDLSLVWGDIYGGLYSKILGILFFLGPEDRIIGQYLNVLLGLTTILIVLKIFREWDVEEWIQQTSLWLMVLFPSAIIFSSILLREAFISFLVVYSFYFCLKWYKSKESWHALSCITLILLAAVFHSGVIGVLVGYAFLFIFYNHHQERLLFTVRSLLPFLALSLFILYVMIVSMENVPFLDKFAFYLDGERELYQMASGGEGEGAGDSAYLTGLSLDTLWEIALFAPVKMFYFISSPLPWGWRGLSDAASFSYDGIIYLGMIGFVLVRYREQVMSSPILLGMLIMILSTVLIFGIGVDNAGTSMRHRYKLLYLIILLAVPVWDRTLRTRGSTE